MTIWDPALLANLRNWGGGTSFAFVSTLATAALLAGLGVVRTWPREDG
ncbi:hypothetical protein AB0M43_24085 [Longispora sp. NPDC051575]